MKIAIVFASLFILLVSFGSLLAANEMLSRPSVAPQSQLTCDAYRCYNDQGAVVGSREFVSAHYANAIKD